MAPVPAITVLQTVAFRKAATSLIGQAGIEAVADYLIANPLAGDVIAHSSGARKLRWAAKGKRGGVRLIYHYLVIADRIYLLDCYAKNEKSDLTPAQTRRLAELMKQLKEKYRAS